MNIQNHQFNTAAGSASEPIALDDVLQKLTRGEHLSREQASALLDSLLDSQTSDHQIADLLTALANKGETSEELTGMASAMRARMIPFSCDFPNVIDTAGTGASKVKTFNVSTAAAFVI